MIIKGRPREGAASLASYLLADKNERVEILEMAATIGRTRHQTEAGFLRGEIHSWEAEALAQTKATKPLYHAQLRTPDNEPLTREQWTRTIDRLEEELNLKGHPRVVISHTFGGTEHVHVVWSRLDRDRGKLVDMKDNFAAHNKVAREMEKEFGLRELVTPEKSKKRHREFEKDSLQARRTGADLGKMKQQITASYIVANGDATKFVRTLDELGYRVSPGDKRAFIITDATGGVYNPVRLIDGMKEKPFREFMAGADLQREQTRLSAPMTKRTARDAMMRDMKANLANDTKPSDNELRRARANKELKAVLDAALKIESEKERKKMIEGRARTKRRTSAPRPMPSAEWFNVD